MIIIADSSALVALAICQAHTLLDKLFDQVRVPQAVYDEILVEGKPGGELLRSYLTGKVISVDLTTIVINAGKLGRGELEAMALYKQLRADFLLIDDKRARKVAQLNNIEITGSQGILVLAKQKGIIRAVRPFLEKLRQSDIRISGRLINRTLQMVNE